MPYTTNSPPVLIGRPGYSAEHYDFAFSGLGDFKTDKARQANSLAMAGKYQEAANVINGLSASTQTYILTYLQQSLSAARYREVQSRVKMAAGAEAPKEGGISSAWSFVKGQITGGGPVAVPAAGPNYLLWGGVAAGGVLLLLLLTRKPKRQAPANGGK